MAMEFFDVIEIRRSVRAYDATQVEEEKLLQILEACNRAPSAGNLQAYEIYVVSKLSKRMALAGAALGQQFIVQAPVALVFCAHPARATKRYKERGETLYAIQDATIACTYAMLAASSLGLASVWVGAFTEEAVREIIDAPRNHRPVAILPIGYPVDLPEKTPRRKFDDLIHFDS
jgi:nitroreductase